jgi:hypothetical protein
MQVPLGPTLVTLKIAAEFKDWITRIIAVNVYNYSDYHSVSLDFTDGTSLHLTTALYVGMEVFPNGW